MTTTPAAHLHPTSTAEGAGSVAGVRPRRIYQWPLALFGGAPLPGQEEQINATVEVYGPEFGPDTRMSPLVFLPGLIGLNEHWQQVVERVCDRVPCILFQSPLLKVRGDMASTLGWARITSEFIRDSVGRPAILVGSSFGGHVALRTTLLVPELVRGLVLTGSSGMGEKSVISDSSVRATPDWCQRRVSELFFDQKHVTEAEVMRAFMELSDRGNARTMLRLSKSARRDHLTDELHLITQPALLIWGKQDIVTPPAACRAFHRLLRGSKVVWFDQCGHVPMVEQPGPFAEAIARFAGEVATLAGP